MINVSMQSQKNGKDIWFLIKMLFTMRIIRKDPLFHHSHLLKKIRTSFLSKIPINPSFKNFLLSAQTFRVKVKRLVEEEW